MVERQRAFVMIEDLAAAYPGRNIPGESAVAWAEELLGLDEAKARRVVDSLKGRSVDPPSVAQVRQAVREVRGDTMSPSGMGWGHTFNEYPCRVCSEHGEPISHGRLLSEGEIDHGLFHARRYIAGDKAHRDGMHEPWNCECGWGA